MSSKAPSSTRRPFSSTLRAFLAESRIGAVSADSWQEFANQVIDVCTTEEKDLIRSALIALEKTKAQVSPQPLKSQVREALTSKLRSWKSSDEEFVSLLKNTFDLNVNLDQISVRPQQQKSKESTPDVIVISDDAACEKLERKRPKSLDSDDIIEVNVSTPGPAKRPRYEKKSSQSQDKDRRTIDKKSNHPLFGFHLLKTEGLKCEGDAYLALEDVIHSHYKPTS